ncbi:MAG: hypothetical protein NTZ07_04645 [Candidatus Woesebacteria bacterium]|nr:hypothetical protein [Candidatus Woesebacteria bacterium]
MCSEEKSGQVESTDPFSIFGELSHLDSEVQHNSSVLASKANELKFHITMRRGRKPKHGLTEEERALVSEIKQLYRENTENSERGEELINTIDGEQEEQD